MLPSSSIALGVLACLIPGIVFVRSAESRRPPARGALSELLEVLTAGFVATFLVLWTLVEFREDGVQALIEHPLENLGDVVSFVGVALVGASAFAFVAGRIVTLTRPKRFAVSVWQATFDAPRKGATRMALVELVDDRRYQGKLHAFSMDPSVSQQISLTRPIRLVSSKTPEKVLGMSRMVFGEDQIRTISIWYHERGKP